VNQVLVEYADKAVQWALDKGFQYCDVRAENISKQGFVIENNEIIHSTIKYDQGLGIRVLNNNKWFFHSITNPENFELIKNSIEKFDVNLNQKIENKINLSGCSSNQETVNFPVKKEPIMDELVKIGLECGSKIQSKDKIIKSTVSMNFSKTEKYFVNSEGAKINQNYTDTVADLVATAHESGLTESVNITEGGRGGIEKLFEGRDIYDTADFIAEKATQLIDAKPAKEDNAIVVMNPDFVALLTHEILGHPSEADRVLGKEMAWAGGAWWAGKMGEKIGAEVLNVFDNPSIEGSLGWYKYDDEGTPSTKTSLIENGVLKNHMQSRETAEIFNVKSSANMRATSYRFMPLIRMACTCIDKGDWEPQEMISEVKNGYYISNMKIPSIDMKRYNWSISCQYAQKIENGELTDLLRDVIVLGTAPNFFQSIDACGKDFTVRPITNCGKGDPMQSMIMGNGGPTIRSVATVKSVES